MDLASAKFDEFREGIVTKPILEHDSSARDGGAPFKLDSLHILQKNFGEVAISSIAEGADFRHFISMMVLMLLLEGLLLFLAVFPNDSKILVDASSRALEGFLSLILFRCGANSSKDDFEVTLPALLLLPDFALGGDFPFLLAGGVPPLSPFFSVFVFFLAPLTLLLLLFTGEDRLVEVPLLFL